MVTWRHGPLRREEEWGGLSDFPMSRAWRHGGMEPWTALEGGARPFLFSLKPVISHRWTVESTCLRTMHEFGLRIVTFTLKNISRHHPWILSMQISKHSKLPHPSSYTALKALIAWFIGVFMWGKVSRPFVRTLKSPFNARDWTMCMWKRASFTQKRKKNTCLPLPTEKK